tara:strand:- start:469 stop:831 length:363 start_codon:yes stop_codon:yes gene_type:complete
MVKKLLLSVLICISGCSSIEGAKSASTQGLNSTNQACDNVYIKYYSWAELKVIQPRPTDEILKSEAVSRESKGSSYYLAMYCGNGLIHSLEKRLNKKTFFKFFYNYDNGKYVGTTPIKIK